MFILNRPNLAVTEVMLLYRCADGRLKMSLGERVAVDNWSKATERVKVKSSTNTLLNRIAHHIAELEQGRKVTGQPILKAQLRSDIEAMLGKVSIPGKIDFWQFVEQFIAERSEGMALTKGSKRFSPETVRHYKHTKDNLKKYEAATGDRLSFASITLDTRRRIIDYFHRKHDHSTNSIGKTIKNFKVFLKEAYNAGHHANTVFMHKEFTVPSEQTHGVYLTIEELDSLAQLECSNGHLHARDWFLIECFTGLRVSDVKRLQSSNIAAGMITIANEKTDEKVVIPVHPVITTILERHNGLPPRISEQKINKYIKELCREAGITGQVLYSITKGGQRCDNYLPKCDLVGNHTGRRSFITNLVRQGVHPQIIMRLAGIRKSATLERYNKLSQEEVAQVAASLPFFTSKG